MVGEPTITYDSKEYGVRAVMRDGRVTFLNLLSLGPPFNYIALRKVSGVSVLIRDFVPVSATRVMAVRSTGRSRTQVDLTPNWKISKLTLR